MGLFGNNRAEKKTAGEGHAAIAQGLQALQQETTVADLMRQKNQRKKVKVMKESTLRIYIAEAVKAVLADRPGLPADDATRQDLEDRAEAKLAEVMRRAAAATEQSDTDPQATSRGALAMLRTRITALTDEGRIEAGAAEELRGLVDAIAAKRATLI